MISKKKKIIEAARITLINEGSSNFSMRKVAAEASISLGNLQYHFKTKVELIQGVLKNYIEIYKAEFEKFIDAGYKGRDGLNVFIRMILIDETNEDDKFFIALFTFLEQKGIEVPLKYFYDELFTILGQVLEKIADFSCSPESIFRGSSLLLPYFEGYGSVASFVKLDHDEIARLLADTVWGILKDQRK